MNWSGAKNVVHEKVHCAILDRINRPCNDGEKPVSAQWSFERVNR